MAAGRWIVSGPSGCGKTVWCGELAQRATEHGLEPHGVISPARFEAGRKVGIDIIDLATHERRRLASSRTPDSRGVLTDDWCLDADTLEWVNQILRGIGDSSLVILDELGPLEFTRAQGLMDGLHLIDRRSSGAAFVVVRPRLLERARARWPDSGIIDIGGGRPPVESVLGDIIASRT